MSDNDNEDIRSTLLYRNAEAMGDRLNDQEGDISSLESRINRLEALLADQAQTLGQLRHQVNVMWVKHMGHGATEDGDND